MNKQQEDIVKAAAKKIIEAYGEIASVRDQLCEDKEYISLAEISAICCTMDTKILHNYSGGIGKYLEPTDLVNLYDTNYRPKGQTAGPDFFRPN
jgi:hypothetical protein